MFKRRLHDKAATACSPPQSADRARVLALTCSQLVLSPPLARHTLRDLLIVCNFAKSSARHSRRRQQRMHATVQSRPVGPSGRQCASRRRTPHTGGLPAAPQALDWGLLPRALLGVLALLCGNGFIVGINQVYDVDIDAVNKPFLPVAAGAALLCPLNSRAVRLGYGWVVRPPCSAARCRTAAYTNRVSMPGGAMLGCQYNGSDALRDTFMRMAVSMASRCTGRQRGKQPLPLSSLSKHMSRACPPPPPPLGRYCASLAQSAARRAPAPRRRAFASCRLGAVPGARGGRPGADGGQLWARDHRPVHVWPVPGHRLQRAAAAPEALCHPGLHDHRHRAALAPAQLTRPPAQNLPCTGAAGSIYARPVCMLGVQTARHHLMSGV